MWISRQSVRQLRRRIDEGQPTACGIWSMARAVADGASTPGEGNTAGQYAEACAIAYLVTGEGRYARQAHEFVMDWTATWTAAELGLAHWALVAAVVQDCCYEAWTAAQQAQMTRLLVKLVDGQKEVEFHRGNPHDVNNNHWAVSHAGAAMAAMAAHGRAVDESGTKCDMTEAVAWARGRVAAFLMHHGDRGLYHEGLGYMAYPASFWAPMVLASRGFDGVDLVERFPNIRLMASSLYAAGAARAATTDEGLPPKRFGRKLSWNDDGQGWMQANPSVLLIHLAAREQQGALRWMYDRLSGVESPDGYERFSPDFCGWFFTLLYYPYDVPAVDPNGILPNHYTDSRQGISIFRNRYRDGEDTILGCYARTTFVGGHAQDDGGSIRLMALGHDWIMGGGQDRPEAEYQSVVTPADGNRPRPYGQGAVIWDQQTDCGGAFGMDLRKVSIGYHERYVAIDWSGRSGADVVLAVLDQVDDHLARQWNWNMTFEPGLVATTHDDGAGFTLAADDGCALTARFLASRPESIQVLRTRDSQRTYQGGYTRNYPGRPYIQARFASRPFLGIYVAMAIGKKTATQAVSAGGVDVRVGDWLWRRPFGVAIPQAYQPGVSGGLCKYPSGTFGFRAKK